MFVRHVIMFSKATSKRLIMFMHMFYLGCIFQVQYCTLMKFSGNEKCKEQVVRFNADQDYLIHEIYRMFYLCIQQQYLRC